jgi:hypothetical protein
LRQRIKSRMIILVIEKPSIFSCCLLFFH